jgi:hypothetical protein
MSKRRELVEPTEAEKRNGWTAESLTAYRAEQEERTQSLLDWGGRAKKRPTMQARDRPWRFRGASEGN